MPRASLCLVACLAASCGTSEPAPVDRPNVLLITVDTLRADHLGLSGHDRPTSPTLDALAARGVVFERAYAPAPWTVPSMVSIHTGLYPSSHTVERVKWAVPSEARTLAEVLAQDGYRTDSVVSNLLVHPRFGHSQGFASFDTDEAQGHAHVSTPGLNERAVALLEGYAETDEPFFLSLLYFDPHYDWRSHGRGFAAEGTVGRLTGEESIEALRELAAGPGGLTDEEVAQLVACYDEEIAFTDDGLAELLAALERLGLADDTLVVVVADHGEEFLEHGWLGHTRFLYEGMVRVPLIVCDPREPGGHGGSFASAVSTVSVMPTILDLVGLDSELHGPEEPSLAQLVRDPAATDLDPRIDGLVFTEVDFVPALEHNMAKVAHLVGVVDGDLKLIRDTVTRELELYDLAADPAELVNLADDPALAARRQQLTRALEAWQAACAERALEPHEGYWTDEEMSELSKLGYLDEGS